LSSSQSGSTTNLLVESGQLPPIHERVRPPFTEHAKCWGACASSQVNLFFADHQHNGQVQEAKAVCLGTHPEHPGPCPVLSDCLEYALANSEKYGVWGGCSERERRRIKRDRRRQDREDAIATGKVISIAIAASRYRQKPPSFTGYQQAREPAPWGHSKALIGEIRLRRQQANRRTASL